MPFGSTDGPVEIGLADLKGRLVETKVTLRYQQIKSPVDGLIFDLKPTSIGFTAQSTQTIMKVVPLGSLEAKVEVPSNKIGFVQVPKVVLKIVMLVWIPISALTLSLQQILECLQGK